MGFWASGDESAASDWKAPADYGTPKGPGAEESKAFNESGLKASIPQSVLASKDNSKAIGTFYDSRASDAWKKRMYGDLAALGSRTSPQAKTTSLGPGAYTSGTKLGPLSTYGGASANFTDSATVGVQQQAMMARLAGIANGTAQGPGVEQLKANLGATTAAQTAAAGSGAARFGGPATLRGLVASKAAAQQQTAATGAIVGAQEQQAAQSMLASLASSARGSEWDAAAGQAALGQQASLWSAGQLNQGAMAQAGFNQQSGMFNASAAQKQYAMDQQTALANMEAYLRSQGLNDQAISARLGFLQDQMNRDKQDKMAFWDYAGGGHKFDASMQFQQDTLAAQQGAARWAAGGQALGSMASAWTSEKDDPLVSGMRGSSGTGGTYEDKETAGKLGGGYY